MAFSKDGNVVASDADDGRIERWSCRTGERIETIEGKGDVSAIASGPPTFPYRALARRGETVVECVTQRTTIATFPSEIFFFEGAMHVPRLATHPNGRVWVGLVDQCNIYPIALEGGPEERV